ncbi:hypothetical protein HK105_202075 [Polyrhizophydium stewartii]|uniref:Major facilitator superfamily (MFS) profile domain-containing protein n=1 Tax=Polyrhizophydium stewartii TaxID=2732419 RepID=A0ABR4NF36_9FUNG
MPQQLTESAEALMLEDAADGVMLVREGGSVPVPASEKTAQQRDGAAKPDHPKAFDDSTAPGQLEEQAADGAVPEPDGGYGWVIVCVSFMFHVTAIGLLSSYGVWQAAYKDVPEFAGSPNLALSLAEIYGARIVCLGGSLILALSLVLASLSTQLWHLHITQGLIFGMGISTSYFPSLAVLSDWFLRRRSTAMGIAFAGAGAGGLALGPLIRLLISEWGWRWALRAIGLGSGAILIACSLLLRMRTRHRASSRIDLTLFKNPLFLRLYAAGFINAFAYFMPFFYMPTFAIKYGMTKEQGALLVGLLNGASGAGRVCLGIAGDIIGPVNAFFLCLLASTILIFAMWPFSTTFGTLIVLCVLFGFASGGLISLIPPVAGSLFHGKGNVGIITGMIFNSFLLGYIFGPPIAGALIDRSTTVGADGTKTTDFVPAIIDSHIAADGHPAATTTVEKLVDAKHPEAEHGGVTTAISKASVVGRKTPSGAATEPPPAAPEAVQPADGSFGWVVVGASILIHFASIGLPASYGVFQAAYKNLPEFAAPAALAASLVLASFSTSIWQLFVTQGFLFGISTSLSFIPAISVLPSWFSKRRGIATDVAVAVAGLGGLALSPLTRLLISEIVIALSSLLLRVRINSASKAALDASLFGNPLFMRMYMAIFMNSFAYFIPFFFVPTYALKYGMSSAQSALLIGLLNGASGAGRITLGLGSDFLGLVNTLGMCLFATTISVFVLRPGSTTFETLLEFVLVFGFFIGGLISLIPKAKAQLFSARGNIASVTGMLYSAFLCGYLFGSPIAGAMLDHFTTIQADGTKRTELLPAIMFSAVCFAGVKTSILWLKIAVGQGRVLAKV